MYQSALHGLLGMRNNRASGLPVIYVIHFSEEKATNKVATGALCPTAGCGGARPCREINAFLSLELPLSHHPTCGWGEMDRVEGD